MLTSTCTVVGLRCAKCGKIDLYSISRFSCGKNGQTKILCECGHGLLIIARQGRNMYRLQVECLLCDSRHSYNLSGNEIWNRQVYSIVCPNTELELCYFGQKEDVIRAIQQGERSVRELIKDYEQYFLNPKVMLRVLDHLHTLLLKSKISCSCGTKELDTDLFPDRVEVSCPYCNAVGVFFAESEKDLRNVEAMQDFELETNSCRYFDDKWLKKRDKAKNK